MGKNSRNDTSIAKGGKKPKDIKNTDDLQSKSSGSGEFDNAIDINTHEGNILVETKKNRDTEKTAKRKAAETRDAQKCQKDEEKKLAKQNKHKETQAKKDQAAEAKAKRKAEKIEKMISEKQKYEMNHSSFKLLKGKIENADISADEIANFLGDLSPSERQKCCGQPHKENIFIYTIAHGNKAKFLALIDGVESEFSYPCCVSGKTRKSHQSILDLLVEHGRIPVSDRKEMLEKLIEKIFKNETRTFANTCTKKQVLTPLHAALVQAQRSMEADAGAIYTMLSQIRPRTERPAEHSPVRVKAGAFSTNMPSPESASTQEQTIEIPIAIDDASRRTSSEIMTTSTQRMTPNLSGDEANTQSIGSASLSDEGSSREISVLGAVDDTALSHLIRELTELGEALERIVGENTSLEEEVRLLKTHVCLCSQHNQGSTGTRRNSASSDSEEPNSFHPKKP